MTEKPYGREHALALLEPTGLQDYWTDDDQGLWPKVEFKQLHAWGLRHEYELAAWKPASVYADASDAPDLIKTPALPFPFDGSDLAAFMLAGFGCLLADFYGDWASGPDEFQLSRIDPGNNFAKRAVREAFEAYRGAVTKVGTWDADALARREATHKAYWNSNNAPTLLKAFEDAQAAWDAAHGKWLTAMVKTLLETKTQAAPEPTHAVPAIASQPSANERQEMRWRACKDAGLKMPQDTYAPYPRGISNVATSLGLKRQSLTDDLDKYRERMFGR